MEELKVGDVVILKAGGPRMTVYQIAGENIGCKWFDNKKLEIGGFVRAELEIDN